MIGVIQQSAILCRGLHALSKSWEVSAFVHNDLRWDNFLLTGKSKSWRVRIIDWEFGGAGDPAVDLGAVFSNFLAMWVFSMRYTRGVSIGKMIRTARYRLEDLQDAIRAFWAGYLRTRGLESGESDRLLERATRFAGARLLQDVFERQQQSTDLTGNAVCILQMSENIFRSPKAAARDLLGLA